MALVLGCALGAQVKIGNNILRVCKVTDPDKEVEINVITEAGEERFTITDEERQKILPEVWVFLGKSLTNDDHGRLYCRLAFEAPRSIRIERFDQKPTGLPADAIGS